MHNILSLFPYRYRTFEGNTDRNTPVQYSFPEPTLVKAFRIHPRDFHGHRSLRFEVHACTFVEAGMYIVHFTERKK